MTLGDRIGERVTVGTLHALTSLGSSTTGLRRALSNHVWTETYQGSGFQYGVTLTNRGATLHLGPTLVRVRWR